MHQLPICWQSLRGPRTPSQKTLALDCMFEPDKPSHASCQSYMLTWPPPYDSMMFECFCYSLSNRTQSCTVIIRCFCLRSNCAFSNTLCSVKQWIIQSHRFMLMIMWWLYWSKDKPLRIGNYAKHSQSVWMKIKCIANKQSRIYDSITSYEWTNLL